ncbi:MAG: MauE/DoxX family redox-associated membrane protein [Pseudomonadota bacterium]
MIKKIITHPYTALFCRLVLGIVFIYASVDKILHPEAFARSVQNYRILPVESINLFAIILPWVEVVCGVLLLLGLFTGGTILLMTLLILVFLIALSSVVIRGIDISCGCFSSNGNAPITFLYVLRDLILFALAFQALLYDRRVLSLDNLISKRNLP